MKSRIFLTGGNGFLGSRIKVCLGERYEIIAPSHQEIDINNINDIENLMQRECPDIVLHCAALSNTWYCEQHAEESLQVNVEATVALAECCKKWKSKFVFISSDQVYNGTTLEGGLAETAPLSPVNVYGQHKLLAEQRVLDILPTAVGLRLTWMYDYPDSKMRLNSNILVNLHQAAEKGSVLKVSTHEHRGFTHVWEVAEKIEKTIDLAGGIYNFGSENELNSYEAFCRCAQIMELPIAIIEADNERFAEQPRNIAMDTHKAQAAGIVFEDSVEGIRKCWAQKNCIGDVMRTPKKRF